MLGPAKVTHCLQSRIAIEISYWVRDGDSTLNCLNIHGAEYRHLLDILVEEGILLRFLSHMSSTGSGDAGRDMCLDVPKPSPFPATRSGWFVP